MPECPVEAIYDARDVPPEWHGFIALNAELSRTCPEITQPRG